MQTRIMLNIAVPEPRPSASKSNGKSLEDQVREAIDLVDTGYCSHVEWLLLNKLYKSLCCLSKQTPRVKNLKAMIEPVLAKYGYHKVSSEE